MLPEADYGLTSQALDGDPLGPNSRYQGDEFLLVRFFKHPKINPQASAERGRPVYSDEDYIQIMQPGNKDSIVIRPAMEADIDRFAEHYRKYKAREEQEVVEGTKLEDWAGCTRSMVEELKFMNIRTVEQLVSVSDSNAQNIMGFHMLKQKALDWLEDNSEDKKQLSEAQDEIATLKAQMAEMMAMMEQQTAPGEEVNETSIEEEEEPEEALTTEE